MPNNQTQAEKNFRMWHAKDPREYLKRSEESLDYEFVCVGRAEELTYISDKWEKDGTKQPYIHDFDSRPKVWIPYYSQADDSEVIGSPRMGYGLLGLKSPSRAAHIAQLGTAEELVITASDGEKYEFAGLRSTPMFSSHDCKAVLILRRSGPVIIRGGKMSVTARGIVK